MKTPEYSHINFTIIDCRYEFEFNGGHIRGAHNIKTPQELENKYLRTPDYRPNDVLIFHCEFSSYRGPNLCELLRNRDRQIHQENYPLLYYPQLYVLKDGYKSFYENFPVINILLPIININRNYVILQLIFLC
jgi:rhodanese-related sulfurtransferase